jgi:hypothetical protein
MLRCGPGGGSCVPHGAVQHVGVNAVLSCGAARWGRLVQVLGAHRGEGAPGYPFVWSWHLGVTASEGNVIDGVSVALFMATIAGAWLSFSKLSMIAEQRHRPCVKQL